MTEHARTISDGLDEMGIDHSSDQVELLLKHLELVNQKNEELNLTRITSIEDGIYLHVIDSLLCVPHLKGMSTHLNMLDIGTGGGFPGIPLSIVLDADVTLLDSIQKKIHAVDGFIHTLGIEDRCCAIASRCEELSRQQPNQFDVVVARAVAQTNVLVEYASPLLVPGGLLVALKANIDSNEFDSAERACSLCGMSIVSRETFELPHEFGHREIIYIEKTKDPTIKLPRRDGMATKRPLGLK